MRFGTHFFPSDLLSVLRFQLEKNGIYDWRSSSKHLRQSPAAHSITPSRDIAAVKSFVIHQFKFCLPFRRSSNAFSTWRNRYIGYYMKEENSFLRLPIPTSNHLASEKSVCRRVAVQGLQQIRILAKTRIFVILKSRYCRLAGFFAFFWQCGRKWRHVDIREWPRRGIANTVGIDIPATSKLYEYIIKREQN